MKKCKTCGVKHNRRSQYCSKKCYFQNYYKKNKTELNEKRRKYNREHYVPKLRKLKTEEEKKADRKKYYEEHKEYFREYHKKYHLEHKKDDNYIANRKRACKKYIKKRYAEDADFREKCKQNWRKNKNGKI